MTQNSLSNSMNAQSAFEEQDRLELHFWRNWTLMVVLIITTVICLVTGVGGGLRERMAEVWPWAGTDTALQISLSVIVLAFTGYLTRQQRNVLGLRRKLQTSLEASNLRVQRNLERLLSLLTVSRALAKETDPKAIFNVIAQTCLDTFECHRVSLMLKDNVAGDLEIVAAKGREDLSRLVGERVAIGKGIAGWVAQHQKPIVLGRTQPDIPELHLANESLSAAMVVPIVVREELVGVLNVSSHAEDQVYTEEDLRALNVFAEHAGVASRHAEQSKWMRETIQRLDEELNALQSQERRAA